MKKCLTFLILLLLAPGYGFAQRNRVTGKVTGADNQGLPAVNVLVSGTSLGTATDAQGNYAIDAPADASLVFSYISYVTQTVAINNRSVVD
ncbi:MAG: carboxypeptidase-like regulatory domain-containing protein, partial [Ferruginibacter sp.]|nr:carboxypeptidase-like regulatory domain-containing protein [Cytophagales bacterium]